MESLPFPELPGFEVVEALLAGVQALVGASQRRQPFLLFPVRLPRSYRLPFVTHFGNQLLSLADRRISAPKQEEFSFSQGLDTGGGR